MYTRNTFGYFRTYATLLIGKSRESSTQIRAEFHFDSGVAYMSSNIVKSVYMYFKCFLFSV